jgi:hypothetical protein
LAKDRKEMVREMLDSTCFLWTTLILILVI